MNEDTVYSERLIRRSLSLLSLILPRGHLVRGLVFIIIDINCKIYSKGRVLFDFDRDAKARAWELSIEY